MTGELSTNAGEQQDLNVTSDVIQVLKPANIHSESTVSASDIHTYLENRITRLTGTLTAVSGMSAVNLRTYLEGRENEASIQPPDTIPDTPDNTERRSSWVEFSRTYSELVRANTRLQQRDPGGARDILGSDIQHTNETLITARKVAQDAEGINLMRGIEPPDSDEAKYVTSLEHHLEEIQNYADAIDKGTLKFPTDTDVSDQESTAHISQSHPSTTFQSLPGSQALRDLTSPDIQKALAMADTQREQDAVTASLTTTDNTITLPITDTAAIEAEGNTQVIQTTSPTLQLEKEDVLPVEEIKRKPTVHELSARVPGMQEKILVVRGKPHNVAWLKEVKDNLPYSDFIGPDRTCFLITTKGSIFVIEDRKLRFKKPGNVVEPHGTVKNFKDTGNPRIVEIEAEDSTQSLRTNVASVAVYDHEERKGWKGFTTILTGSLPKEESLKLSLLISELQEQEVNLEK